VDSGGGTSTQLLRVSADTGVWVIRNRFRGGFRAPTHLHTGQVHAFTNAGHWGYEEYDFVATAGSYVHESAGAKHTLVIPEDNEGDVDITFVVEGANVNYAADGSFLGVQDGRSILRNYLQHCADQGFPAPDGILV
jgi:hypothetical protein